MWLWHERWMNPAPLPLHIEKIARVPAAHTHTYTIQQEARAAEEKGETVRRKTLRWLIPAELSGLLIGKRGIGREAIQQESGAFVKIAHEQELPPGSTEKCVFVCAAVVVAVVVEVVDGRARMGCMFVCGPVSRP